MADPKDENADEGSTKAAPDEALAESERAPAAPADGEPAAPATSLDEPAAARTDAPAAGSAAPAVRPKKKAKAKAQSPEDIRDRNQRIREEAAAKRRAKRESEERRVAPARGLETGEIVDDALARSSHAIGTFLRRHFNVVQWVVVATVVGAIGYQIFNYRRGLARDRATAELARAVTNESGRIGSSEPPPADRYTDLGDPRPAFADHDVRLKSAEKEYRKAKEATSGPVSALATLGLAGILFDQRKYAEAKSAYEQVKNSELATHDRDAKARAVEGIALSLEALGQTEPALKAFRELEALDAPGTGPLGQYHQARLLMKQNERDKAKALLEKAHAKLSKSEKNSDKSSDTKTAMQPPGYLEVQVRELLSSIDPNAVPEPEMPGITPEQIERLKQQLKLQTPNVPRPTPAPMPAPMAPMQEPMPAPEPGSTP